MPRLAWLACGVFPAMAPPPAPALPSLGVFLAAVGSVFGSPPALPVLLLLLPAWVFGAACVCHDSGAGREVVIAKLAWADPDPVLLPTSGVVAPPPFPIPAHAPEKKSRRER